MTERTKILTVDDSRMMRRMVGVAIETIGYQILEASNGRDALKVLEEQGDEVALVLLDWNMPIMNGIDTLRAVKSHDRLKGIPVMMVTSEGDQRAVIQAIRSGAKHYLNKPFSQQDLVLRMMECLDLGLTG